MPPWRVFWARRLAMMSYMEGLKEVQRIEYERGGHLAWGIAEGIDLAASKVKDLPQVGGYARMQLEKTWMSADS